MLNVGERRGLRPLHIAINNLYFQSILPVISVLLEAGADPNVADAQNNRPLNLVTYRFSLPLFRVLLEAGADPNVVTNYGESVFTAHVMGNSEAVQLLLDHDVILTDTFLERARRHASDEMNALIEQRLINEE